MKQIVTIEGTVDRTDGDLVLLKVAIALGQFHLNPESLVWTMNAESNDVRLWLVLDGEETTSNVFAEECRSFSGVRYLAQAPDEARPRLLERIRELESRKPCEPTPVSALHSERPITGESRIFLPPDAEFVD